MQTSRKPTFAHSHTNYQNLAPLQILVCGTTTQVVPVLYPGVLIWKLVFEYVSKKTPISQKCRKLFSCSCNLHRHLQINEKNILTLVNGVKSLFPRMFNWKHSSNWYKRKVLYLCMVSKIIFSICLIKNKSSIDTRENAIFVNGVKSNCPNMLIWKHIF